jgi:hypothetical protein
MESGDRTSLLSMPLTLPCQASLRRFIIEKGPETLHRHADEHKNF